MTETPRLVGRGASGIASLMADMACDGHQAAELGTLNAELYLEPDSMPGVSIPPSSVDPSGYLLLKAVQPESASTSSTTASTTEVTANTTPTAVGDHGTHIHGYTHLHGYTHQHTTPSELLLFEGDRVLVLWLGGRPIVLGRL